MKINLTDFQKIKINSISALLKDAERRVMELRETQDLVIQMILDSHGISTSDISCDISFDGDELTLSSDENKDG